MSTTTVEAKAKKSGRSRFDGYWQKYGAVAILILVALVFSLLEPSFLTGGNPLRIVEQSSVTILLGFGEFFAILLAGIDLSVGSVMALTGVITANLMVSGMPWPLAVLLGGIGCGALFGLINGALVAVTRLHPFIITLGTMSIFRGLTYVVSGATAVSGFTPQFSQAVNGKLFGFLPTPIVIVLVVLAILMFFTMKTRAGRNLYAIGGSREAAWYAGISYSKNVILAFVISGTCAGMAGVVNVARVGAAEPNAGTGYETFAIAAVIIAGTSFFGGEGVIAKVLLGGLIIGTINNGLNMVGVSSYYQQIAMGGLIVLAVTLDRFLTSKRPGSSS